MANIEIGGRLHSTATGNVVTGANEVLDDIQNKKQQEINAELIEAVGTGGSVDSRIAAAKAEIKGNATSACDTLGEAEAKINANATAISNEATRAVAAEEALDGRVDTLEDAVGTGGSVDSRISAAVATETTRAQAAEADRYTKSETYTKTEVNGLVDTPHQEYVTVDAYASLPETGSKDTIYRVSNYNGSTSQVDTSVYSEYAWDGSQYIFLCVKSQIGEVFDISVYNNNAKYADLAAALNGGANIPQSLQKGGMSVKFVQSSDNKYVQYRCIADEFTTDTTKWASCGVGVYVDSPEFLVAWLDKDGKIMFGIRPDADFFFGAGVPQQIVDYITSKIEELSLDEYEDIVHFLDGLIESDVTLQQILSNLNQEITNKVDKVNGRSLIDAGFADIQSSMGETEYIEVKLDSEKKILEGITVEGEKEINIPIKLPSSKIVTTDNPEWIEAKLDKDGRILEGITNKGEKYIGELIEDEDIYDVPDFYLTHLKDKESVINNKILETGLNGDSFVFMTDTHYETNYFHSPALVKHILDNTNIFKVFNGGDLINWGNKNVVIPKIRKWMNWFNFTQLYVAIGNHDVNTTNSSSTEYFTDTEIYSLFLKHLEKTIDLSNRFYYYVDNPTQKIRYFVLDCHWPTNPDYAGRDFHYSEQLDWMEAKSQELGSDWSIIVIQHIIWGLPYTIEGGVIVSGTKTALAEDLIAKLDTMADDQDMPTIIGVFSGHTHCDLCEYSSKGYPIISTLADAAWDDVADHMWPSDRPAGSVNEQGLDVFTIDKTQRKIYATRVGYGSNREFTY